MVVVYIIQEDVLYVKINFVWISYTQLMIIISIINGYGYTLRV